MIDDAHRYENTHICSFRIANLMKFQHLEKVADLAQQLVPKICNINVVYAQGWMCGK